jgi:hypothetical protein
MRRNVDFLIFLLLFVVLCGALDHWAAHAPEAGSRKGR